MDTGFYENLITSANQRPKYMALLRTLLEHGADLGTFSGSGLLDAFDLDNAAGAQLDTIGYLVGAERNFSAAFPALDDDLFRAVIRARIMQDHWDGSGEGFAEIWETAFGDTIWADIVDNQDMSIGIWLLDAIRPELLELLNTGAILPFPAGVGVNLYSPEAAEAADIYTGADLAGDHARIRLETI